MQNATADTSALGHTLRTSTVARLLELVAVFAIAVVAIVVAIPLVGKNPLARQAVVWVANVYMSLFVRLRLDIKRERVELNVEERRAANSTAPGGLDKRRATG